MNHFADSEQVIFSHFVDFEQVIIHFADFEQTILTKTPLGETRCLGIF